MVALKDCSKVLQVINGQHRIHAILELNNETHEGEIRTTVRLCDTMEEMEKLYKKVHTDSTKLPFNKIGYIEKQNKNIILLFRKEIKKEYNVYLSETKSDSCYCFNDLVQNMVSNKFFGKKIYSKTKEIFDDFEKLNLEYFNKYYKGQKYKCRSNKEKIILTNKMVFLLKTNNSFKVYNKNVVFCDPQIIVKNKKSDEDNYKSCEE